MPHKSFRDWFPLFASVASFIASIIVPITKIAVTPTPFVATIHFEALSFQELHRHVRGDWAFAHLRLDGLR